MKIDADLPASLRSAAANARCAEAAGYDGLWTIEGSHDPFFPLVLAAENTERVELATGIAVAFARSPMTLANVGWDLQEHSRGRFILGLGSQVKPHIEKRFSMPWSQPAARMRELIAALHAIWDCWQDGTKLDFRGDFYQHTLMTPMFTPEPHPYGPPRVFMGAVGAGMVETAAEAADGILLHPFTTERYLHEVTLPTIGAVLQRTGRERSSFAVSCPAFVVVGRDEVELEIATTGMRRRLAFYGSTPAYRAVLDLHGWGPLHEELNRLSKLGGWEQMGDLIDEEVLTTFAVVGAPETIAVQLHAKYGGIVDRISCNTPYDIDTDVLAQLVAEFKVAAS